MEETVLRAQAMRTIDTGISFSIGFVMADRRRGTGGEYKELKNWRKFVGEPVDAGKPGSPRKKSELLIKDPNHNVNKTFNIYNPHDKSQHPITVHYRLFDRFNGKTVIK
jgi:hypothetical protein